MFYPAGIGPFTTLPAGTSAGGAGTAIDLGFPMSNHLVAIVGSAGISAGAVKLEGSLDDVNWFQLIAPVTATASSTVTGTIANTPCRYVRGNVSTAIVGGTVTVLVNSSGA